MDFFLPLPEKQRTRLAKLTLAPFAPAQQAFLL
jgi:hypothetical protein